MDAGVGFYQTLTTVSFMLLGLWFGVIGIAHGDWRGDARRHRSTLHITLHFVLPGTIGLVAVLAGDVPIIWRVAFMLGGLVGVAESLDFLRSPEGPTKLGGRILRALDPALYLLVVMAAFVTGRPWGLRPLQVEGIVTGVTFVVGLIYMWLALAERPAQDGRAEFDRDYADSWTAAR